MKTYDDSMARQFGELLDQLEAQLRASVQGRQQMDTADADATAHEVADQKDLASRDAESLVQQAQLDHAAAELQQVQAARHRLDLKEYGHCLDCGEAIDLRRLTALPAARHCAQCQARHESAHSPSGAH